jgi:hypothetical protein
VKITTAIKAKLGAEKMSESISAERSSKPRIYLFILQAEKESLISWEVSFLLSLRARAL